MPADLFSPLEIRGVRLKNRIVASPMWQYAGVDGVPTDIHALHLGRLAEGGAGLVFQEGTTVDRRGRGTRGDLGLWDDTLTPHYSRLTTLIRASGAVPGIQLIHAGRKGRKNPPWNGDEPSPPATSDWPVLGPSALPMDTKGANVPTEMSLQDIRDTVQSWVNAARRADEAGYEVLEVQAGHGYLIHSFLSAVSNRRTDDYGGSAANRSRLLIEIVDGIRRFWPTDKALFVRLSCVDVEWSMDQTIGLVHELATLDVDVIDCSTGGLTGVPGADSPRVGYGYQVPYAAEVRSRANIATMAVGHIVHARQAQTILANDQADLVALGRELLHNPNWPIDAARKLGVRDPYQGAPQRISYWLSKRDASFADFVPSTEGRLNPGPREAAR
jgi:2,4-dienoyl-CoA reductase-like NADH-dependent reductase (Old Yellow Enzyme family)